MLKLFSSTIRNSTLLQALKIPKLEIPTSHFHSTIPPSNPAIQFILEEAQDDLQSSPEPIKRLSSGNGEISRPTESDSGIISHPYPEWVDLMETLLKNGYFASVGSPCLRNNELGNKDSNEIRTACLNFARDQFGLVRYLSQKDIEVIAQAGCPSVDRKVVNSGKRLRAHLGIDEGNVCSSCILRGNCERAYVKVREDEGRRTVDVMRLLFIYGLDPISGSVENKPCLNERVKESVRKLLKEIVEFSKAEGAYETNKALIPGRSSTQQIAANCRDGQMKVPMKQGDWLCTKCNFLNFARNIKCLRCNDLSQERLHNLRVEQDNLPLKKGDWICDKCNFLNFAKNTRCLQCKENPPKRLLHPGEWECESCNYINFKRNVVCLKCDHRRPRASNCASSTCLSANPDTSNHLSRPYLGTEKQLRDEFNKPKFVKGDGEYPDDSVLWNHETGYADFPILGGKSDLSRNEQKRERWKREMTEKSTKAAKAKEKAQEFKSCFVDNSKHFQLTDDEEMADWFGQ
nr:zinc finger protein VAR3, chloroplastic-like [Ipomoea batatas]